MHFLSDPYYAPGGAFAKLVGAKAKPSKQKPSPKPIDVCDDIDLNVHITSMIRSYQQRGHLVADLDPLGIIATHEVRSDLGVQMRVNDLVTRYPLNITLNDMEKQMKLPASTFIGGKETSLPLRFDFAL